jgi:uncharacterized SAM-binding protein YcdF (DUF218 family)
VEIDVSTRAFLKLLLLPPGNLLILLLIGWLFARHVFGRLLILLAITGFYLLSTPAAVDWLAEQLETIPAATPAELRHSGAQAILVPLAGVRRDNPELAGADALGPMSLQRIDHALLLHRETGLPIVLSGGKIRRDDQPLAAIAAEWLRQRTEVKPLALDTASRDTWENMRNSAGLLRHLDIQRVVLVTHAYHMPRALLGAQAAGIDAVAAPFAFESPSESDGQPASPREWAPHPGYLGRSYLILHEMAGLVWYGLTRQ